MELKDLQSYDLLGMLQRLGIKEINPGATTGTEWIDTTGDTTESVSPIDGELIAKIKNASFDEYESVVNKAEGAFKTWKTIPAPKRGEVVRQIGLALREYKEDLGMLVTYEMGKIYQEGLGEVQEMIDICDFAVGQSRQLYGYTMQSERPEHKMYDQYHPLGILGLITSFNFPVAVWAWNAMIAAIAGDVVIWKPSSKTPLTAIATQNIIQKVLHDNNVPEGVFNLVIAKSSVLGNSFLEDTRLPLVSMTGSTESGKRTAELVSKRLGRTILELGGNDGLRGFPPERTRSNLERIVSTSKDSGAAVVLLGIKIPSNYGPRYTQAFEAAFRDTAESLDIPWIEFFMEGVALNEDLMQDDGIHPNAAAQPILLDNAWPAIETALGPAN